MEKNAVVPKQPATCWTRRGNWIGKKNSLEVNIIDKEHIMHYIVILVQY